MTTENLLPHQERVVQEKAELDDKISKLATFKESSTFESLSEAERGNLNRQLAVMKTYSSILLDRIKAF